jgi:predicted dehydrogenase
VNAKDMRQDLSGRRLRAGIVGGGQGAFIGAVHRIACELDGQAWVIAGALSSDAKTARRSAKAWYLERSYASYADMAQSEAARADGIDFVIVATPNDLHYPVAKAFLEQGIPVVCDKPLAHTLEHADALAALVASSGQLFALTHNYTGYPAVREARERVRGGQLGVIRKVLVEYQQDWLMTPLERSSHKQALWRTDPARAGLSCCLADIGSHAENLCEYVTGRRIVALCADLSSFVAGRALDDDANILLRLEGGAKGTLTCSQVACGEENALSIRVYGSKAGIEWHQEEPNTLIFKPANLPWERLRTAGPYLSAAARAASRVPPGHPEGYLEAFAQLYRDVIEDLRRRARGEPLCGGYPTAADGLRGMQVIAAAVRSSAQGGRWIDL